MITGTFSGTEATTTGYYPVFIEPFPHRYEDIWKSERSMVMIRKDFWKWLYNIFTSSSRGRRSGQVSKPKCRCAKEGEYG